MKSVASLSIAYTNVVGDSIVAAGTIAYLGAFTSEFRHMLVHDWLTTLRDTTVPHTDGTNVCSTLANPVEVRTWACSYIFLALSENIVPWCTGQLPLPSRSHLRLLSFASVTVVSHRPLPLGLV